MAVPSASYVLHILGTGGLDINQTKYIGFREKGLSIYIQTDKAIYKPGQKSELMEMHNLKQCTQLLVEVMFLPSEIGETQRHISAGNF